MGLLYLYLYINPVPVIMVDYISDHIQRIVTGQHIGHSGFRFDELRAFHLLLGALNGAVLRGMGNGSGLVVV